MVMQKKAFLIIGAGENRQLVIKHSCLIKLKSNRETAKEFLTEMDKLILELFKNGRKEEAIEMDTVINNLAKKLNIQRPSSHTHIH